MRKVYAKLVLLLVIALLIIQGCVNENHETTPEVCTVRIYDVIPQGWDYVNEQTEEHVADLQKRMQSADDNISEKATEELIAMEKVIFEYHDFKVGPFRAMVDERDGIVIPYAKQVKKIEELSGISIDYVILESWEELETELEKSENDGITKIVLFDNTYNGSLIQVGKSSRYANLEKVLDDFGFYDDTKYNQMVLSSGMIDGKQVFVPLLYDVNGMIQGEAKQYSWEGNVLYEPNPIEGESIDFESFIAKLNQQMQDENSRKSVDFISTALSTEVTPEMFLYAAGIEWEDYRNQKNLFELLYQYYQIYMGTQIDKSGMSRQAQWGIFLSDMEDGSMMRYREDIPNEIVMDLELNQYVDMVPRLTKSRSTQFFLDSCTFIIQSSLPGNVSYHSVLSLLDLASYYLYWPFWVEEGTMGYCPISVLGETDKYAAQPNNYVAVVSDGSMKHAVKVIEAMAQLEVDFKYGFSINCDVRDKQLNEWSKEYGECYSYVGSRMVIEDASKNDGTKVFKEVSGGSYWDEEIGLPNDNEFVNIKWKENYLGQVRNQLDNICIAQIPDQEILEIWHKTMFECVRSELSQEVGFELLCERMDAFYLEGGE